jgi:hypothetical protein
VRYRFQGKKSDRSILRIKQPIESGAARSHNASQRGFR